MAFSIFILSDFHISSAVFFKNFNGISDDSNLFGLA